MPIFGLKNLVSTYIRESMGSQSMMDHALLDHNDVRFKVSGLLTLSTYRLY